MGIILTILAVYYVVGLVLCALIYAFIRSEYGGIGEFAKLVGNMPDDLTGRFAFKLTTLFLFFTFCPFISPVLFVNGFYTDWKDRKEEER